MATKVSVLTCVLFVARRTRDRIRTMTPIGAKVVDLFCGAGGLTYGLEKAGLDVAEGIDVDEHCRYPYETNTRARLVCKDIHEYGAEDLRSAWDGADVRVLVGCAPCQPFSTYSRGRRPRKRGRRWELIQRFAELIEQTLPDIVSMENVPPLARTKAYRGFVGRLLDAGYRVEDAILDCRHYGAPQTRRRLVLLASTHGRTEFVEASHLEADTWTNVASTIGHLPALGAGEVDPTTGCIARVASRSRTSLGFGLRNLGELGVTGLRPSWLLVIVARVEKPIQPSMDAWNGTDRLRRSPANASVMGTGVSVIQNRTGP